MEVWLFVEDLINKKNKKIRGGVRQKLIAIMLLIAIIPLVVAVSISYINSTNSAKEQAKQNLDWQAKYIESEIDKIFKV